MKTKLAELLKKYPKPREVRWVRTGVHAIDLLMGGGIPRGRVVEFFGSEQSGKSLLAWTCARAFQKAGGVVGLFDIEATAPLKFMQALGVDTDLIAEGDPRPRTVEEVRDRLIDMTQKIRAIDKEAPILFIWDSVAATKADAEWKNADPDTLELNEKAMAERAQAMSDFFSAYTQFMTDNDVTLICVNQLRDKIGVMFGRKDESPGGRALKFHTSVRLELTRGRQIKHETKTVGVECHASTQKNKCASPFRRTTLSIMWDVGFIDDSGLDTLLIDAKRVTKHAKGGFTVGDETFPTVTDLIAKKPEVLRDWLLNDIKLEGNPGSSR